MFNWFDPYGLKKIQKLLDSNPLPIVILTGAGISKESGLATFRGNGGMWEGIKIEDVAHVDALIKNKLLVYKFYNQRKTELCSERIKPNPAHLALAKLESELGEVSIITQNIDNLHEQAGSEQINHIHGELLRKKCLKCNYSWPSIDLLSTEDKCQACGSSEVRPDVVFFKEAPYRMDDALNAIRRAKVFISIGTSGLVYPAAHFVIQAKMNGAVCIEINPEKTATSRFFDLVIRKPASVAVPKIVEFLLKEK